jgi:hypothetical protein
MRIKKMMLLASLFTAGTTVAWAHHSYSAFEMRDEKVISGIVKKFDWSNPHSWIWIDVPNEQGGVDTWGIEGMSPNYLGRRGWTRTTLKTGDKITITIHPLRNGEHGGSFVSAKRPNGELLGQTGPITEP